MTERLTAGAAHGAGDVGNAIVDHIIYNIGRIAVGGRSVGLEAAPLLDRHVHQHGPGLHGLDDAARTLKAENPKGRLLEWCTAHHAESPRFEVRAVVEGFHAEASVALAGGATAQSGRFGASTKKLAEQAAARGLLAKLRAEDATETDPVIEPHGTEAPKTVNAAAPSPASVAPAPGRDPMMLLNEMRQLGLLRDFGTIRMRPKVQAISRYSNSWAGPCSKTATRSRPIP